MSHIEISLKMIRRKVEYHGSKFVYRKAIQRLLSKTSPRQLALELDKIKI